MDDCLSALDTETERAVQESLQTLGSSGATLRASNTSASTVVSDSQGILRCVIQFNIFVFVISRKQIVKRVSSRSDLICGR